MSVGTVYTIAFDDSGKLLATITTDQSGALVLFAVSPSGRLTQTDKLTPSPQAMAFRPGGRFIAIASSDRSVTIYSISTEGKLAPVAPPTLLEDYPEQMVFSADGTRLAIAGLDSVTMLSVSSRGLLSNATPLALPYYPGSIAFAPDGKTLALSSYDSTNGNGRVSSYAVSSGDITLLDTVEVADGSIDALAFSPDGRLLAAGTATSSSVGSSASVYRVSATGHMTLASQIEQTPWIRSVAFTPNGRFVVTNNMAAPVLSVSPSGDLSSIAAPGGLLNRAAAVALSPDGRFMAAALYDKGISMSSISESGAVTPIGTPTSTDSWPTDLAITRTAPSTVAVLSRGSNSVSTYSLAYDGGLPRLGSAQPTGPVPFGLAVSGQGTAATLSATENSVSLLRFDVNGVLSPLSSLTGIVNRASAISVSPDGSSLAVASGNPNSVTVYPIRADGVVDGPGVITALGYQAAWTKVAYSPDGRFIAVTNEDSMEGGRGVKLLRVSPGGVLTLVSARGVQGDWPNGLYFNADGTRLAVTTTGTGNVRKSTLTLFAVSSSGDLTPLGTNVELGYYASSVSFSSNGKMLAAASTIGISIFALAPDGTLTSLGNPAYGAGGLGAVVFSADNRFLIATDGGRNELLTFPLAAPWLSTYVSSSPPEYSNNPSASFSFSANYASTLECRIENSSWSPCAGQQGYSNLPDGRHTFTVRATDLVGNAEVAPAERSWTIDRTPPARPVQKSPADGARARRATASFSWSPTTDALSGVDRFELWIDGASSTVVMPSACTTTCEAAPDQPLGDGSHTWSIRTVDRAGNIATSTTRTFSVDAAPPEPFVLDTPADGAWLGTRRPRLSWHPAGDEGAGVARYAVVLDDRDVEASLPSSTTSWIPDADLAEGAYHWQVVAYDANDNQRATAIGTFVVDTTPPKAAFVASPNPALSGRDVAFDASASAGLLPDALVSYQWDLDGDGSFETTSSGPRTSRTYTTTAALTIPVTLRVTDRVGQTAEAGGTVRVYSQSAPKPPGLTIDDQARYTHDSDVTLSVVAPSFATHVDIANDGSFLSARTVPVTSKIPWKLDVSNADHEASTVYVRFTRGLIVSDPYTDDIIFDRSPPVISSASKSVRKGQVVVDVTARDKGLSGIGGVQVTNDKRHPRSGYTDAHFRSQRAQIKLAQAKKAKAKTKAKTRAAKSAAQAIDPDKPVYVRLRDKAGNVSTWFRVRAR